MLCHESIIWFGGSDWWAHHKRNEQYTCEYFASENTVLYINSIGVGLPKLTKPGVLKRLYRKVHSLSRWLTKTDSNVWVGSPFFIPLWSVPLIKKLNKTLLLWQVKKMMAHIGMSDPVLVSSLPTVNEFLHLLPHKAHVYNLFDNFAVYHEQQYFMSVVENDYALRESADVVICTSKGMYNEISEKREHVFWIPHGVHPGFLNQPDSVDEPDEIKHIPHPRISYWGQLDWKVNDALIEAIAINRPDWHFVLYGTKTFNYPHIERLPNVHIAGYAPPAYLHKVGSWSDILILPWNESNWIRSSCPIKYREYLAIGKPVISSPTQEVELAYPGAAMIASSPEEWIESIEISLAQNSSERETQRRELVKGYDLIAADTLFNDAIAYAIELKRKAA